MLEKTWLNLAFSSAVTYTKLPLCCVNLMKKKNNNNNNHNNSDSKKEKCGIFLIIVLLNFRLSGLVIVHRASLGLLEHIIIHFLINVV